MSLPVFKPPFFYGWLIVACAACANFARQGAAVATLSMFVVPMTLEFDWSRSAISGAVSLGGVLGALTAPYLGAMVDRTGARGLLVVGAVVISFCAVMLAGVQGLVGFYVFFGISRMAFAGAFEVGTTTAIANWFERLRGRAMSYVSVSIGVSLAILPLIAELSIEAWGWRWGWVVVGTLVLVIGTIPVALIMRRRPEDLGLEPDGGAAVDVGDQTARRSYAPSRDFSRAEAVRTPTFWLLMLFTGLAFCMQAGISLHQAPLLIEQGIAPTDAAFIISVFSLASASGAFLFGRLGERFSMRVLLPFVAFALVVAALVMRMVDSALLGYISGILFGIGIGGLLTLPQLAFAVFYGRTHYGAIRGLALPVQVVGQAAGPLVAGVAHDLTGDYQVAMLIFAALGAVAMVLGVLARAPEIPSHSGG